MRTSEVFILGTITGAVGILLWGRQIQSSVRGKTWAVRSKAAEGIRARTHAHVTVGITGIAGPGGATATKPVGTVVIAVIVPGQPTYVRTYSFLGGRAMVKFQATQAAFDRVRRMLADAPVNS